MSKLSLGRVVSGAWQVYTALEQMEAYRRAREAEERMLESLEEAREVRRFIEREEASNKLGAGRLGTFEDAAQLGMSDPAGLFLGALDGRPIFYNGTGHLLLYGPTQTGKGRDLVLPNLAHVGNRSIVCTDIKNGENAYASAHHRRVNLKHRTVALNPYKLLGAPSFRLNPFNRLIQKAQSGETIAVECIQSAMSICTPKHGSDAWVAEGAQEYIATWIEHRARFRPDECTPSNLWRFVNGDTAAALKDIGRCGVEGLEYVAASALRTIMDAPEQWQAYHSDMRTGIRSFRPGEPLAEVTETSNFDPATMRDELTSVYLMSAESQLEGSARWISLTVNAILETAANTPGPVPVLFMIDELANLPYIPAIPKALTLYAGLGIQLWGICQGRQSLAARGYKDATIKVFEEQAAIFGMWGVEDVSLLRDIETWSGKKAVAIRGVNNSGGQVSSASFGISEHARPVLQTEDIRSVCDGQQILRLRGNHLFVADRVPWFTVERWREALRDVRGLHHVGRKTGTLSRQKQPGGPESSASPVRRLTYQPDVEKDFVPWDASG